MAPVFGCPPPIYILCYVIFQCCPTLVWAICTYTPSPLLVFLEPSHIICFGQWSVSKHNITRGLKKCFQASILFLLFSAFSVKPCLEKPSGGWDMMSREESNLSSAPVTSLSRWQSTNLPTWEIAQASLAKPPHECNWLQTREYPSGRKITSQPRAVS